MRTDLVDEFFGHLAADFAQWKRHDRGDAPQVHDLTNELSASVFSFSGYETTDAVRASLRKDQIVCSMLERSIDGPIQVVDVGTYNGARVHRILDALGKKARSRIIAVHGVDVNAQALDQASEAFRGYDVPFIPHHARIEDVDMSSLDSEAKVVLALENIFLNIQGAQKRGIDELACFIGGTQTALDEGLLIEGELLGVGDTAIIEMHKSVKHSAYPENVPEFMRRYFVDSGIQRALGGRLDAVFNEEGKFIFIDDLPESVTYKGKAFAFEKRALYHDQGPGNIPFMASPVIYIGTSRVLADIPGFLIQLVDRGIEAPEKKDILQIDQDLVMRQKHIHGAAYLANLAETGYTAFGAEPAPLTDTIMRNSLFPKHYARWLEEPSRD